MYMLYCVDNINGKIIETPIGVIENETKAKEWINRNKVENAVKKEMYPYYKIKFTEVEMDWKERAKKCIKAVAIGLGWNTVKKRKKENKKSEYDIFLDELLSLIKEKGILVKIMPKGTDFLFDTHEEYKQHLGAVALKDKKGNITNIYVAYEDYDGSIKYYDYPEYTQKEIKEMRKKYEKGIATN